MCPIQLQEASLRRLSTEETVPHSVLSPLQSNTFSKVTSILPITRSLQEHSPGLG